MSILLGRLGEEFCHPGGVRSRAAPPRWEEPNEVARALNWDSSQMLPRWGVQGTSLWLEAPGKTQTFSSHLVALFLPLQMTGTDLQASSAENPRLLPARPHLWATAFVCVQMWFCYCLLTIMLNTARLMLKEDANWKQVFGNKRQSLDISGMKKGRENKYMA